MNLVVGDELLGELLRALAVALVVVGEQLHLHLPPADVDATGRVDAREPQVVGERLLLAFVREAAGQGEWGADTDDVRRLNGAGPDVSGD